jgi:hypothetical protein
MPPATEALLNVCLFGRKREGDVYHPCTNNRPLLTKLHKLHNVESVTYMLSIVTNLPNPALSANFIMLNVPSLQTAEIVNVRVTAASQHPVGSTVRVSAGIVPRVLP